MFFVQIQQPERFKTYLQTVQFINIWTNPRGERNGGCNTSIESLFIALWPV